MEQERQGLPGATGRPCLPNPPLLTCIRRACGEFWRPGHLKFWKKKPVGVEFAKHFRAHLGPIHDLAVSPMETLPCNSHPAGKAQPETLTPRSIP